jgi:C1A family cysteine protease
MKKKSLRILGIFLILLACCSNTMAEPVSKDLEIINAGIKAHGAKWKAGKTKVSKAICNCVILDESPAPGIKVGFPELDSTDSIPSTFDWRNQGPHNIIGNVKQQRCGDCWAFATTAAAESYRNSDPVVISDYCLIPVPYDLSEQRLLASSHAGGCNGGYLTSASEYIRTNGLPLEKCCKYLGSTNDCNITCNIACKGMRRYIGRWFYPIFRKPSAVVMAKAIYYYGPIVTTINVYDDFRYYKSGVYSRTSNTYLGLHAVLVIGYNDIDKYFICKNSWGTSWGEAGFFKISYSEVGISGTAFGYETIAYTRK